MYEAISKLRKVKHYLISILPDTTKMIFIITSTSLLFQSQQWHQRTKNSMRLNNWCRLSVHWMNLCSDYICKHWSPPHSSQADLGLNWSRIHPFCPRFVDASCPIHFVYFFSPLWIMFSTTSNNIYTKITAIHIALSHDLIWHNITWLNMQSHISLHMSKFKQLPSYKQVWLWNEAERKTICTTRFVSGPLVRFDPNEISTPK